MKRVCSHVQVMMDDISPYFLFVYFFFFSCYGDHRDLHSFPHDALPILRRCCQSRSKPGPLTIGQRASQRTVSRPKRCASRSEEHTSELQSHHDLVCRLLLEKKNNPTISYFRQLPTFLVE